MSVNDFIKLREKDWKRLQLLVDQHQGRKRLSAVEVKELGELYRTVTSDLAIARRDFGNQKVSVYLNQLLTRVHSYIYQQDVSNFRALLRYFTHDIPTAFRQTSGFVLAAFLMFMIPAIIGFTLAYRTPEVADPLGLSDQRATLANNETWTDIPLNERPYASAFIMTNNIRVAMLAFGGGMLLGLFTTWILMFNGIHIGAVLGLAYHYGMGSALVDFIFAHGVIELSVIFMAGGAGLQLGWAILNPGLYSRQDALKLAGRRSVPLIVIGIVLLVIAGSIEGFVSPSDLPFGAKVLVGVGSGVMMYAYLIFTGFTRNVELKM